MNARLHVHLDELAESFEQSFSVEYYPSLTFPWVARVNRPGGVDQGEFKTARELENWLLAHAEERKEKS